MSGTPSGWNSIQRKIFIGSWTSEPANKPEDAQTVADFTDSGSSNPTSGRPS